MTTRHKVATTEELTDASRVIAEVNGQEIAVFQLDGEYHAIANYCVHQAGPLCEGELTCDTYIDENDWDWRIDDEATYVTCPWHGWLFDVTDGVNPHNPKYKVPTYDVEVDGEDIFVIR